MISNGKTCKTTQINPEQFYDVFTEILASGYEEKAKKLLIAVLEYIVKYYKS